MTCKGRSELAFSCFLHRESASVVGDGGRVPDSNGGQYVQYARSSSTIWRGDSLAFESRSQPCIRSSGGRASVWWTMASYVSGRFRQHHNGFARRSADLWKASHCSERTLQAICRWRMELKVALI